MIVLVFTIPTRECSLTYLHLTAHKKMCDFFIVDQRLLLVSKVDMLVLVIGQWG